MRILRTFRMASSVALGLTACIGMSAQTATTKKEPHISIREVHVRRVNIVTTESFDTVVARIDAAIGHPDIAAFRKEIAAADNEAEIEKIVEPVTQPNGLMEFTRFGPGEYLRKENVADKLRILRIVAGNPITMSEMAKHVVDAASYAPVTILIDERPGSVLISYDRMASYLASYGNSDALKVARELDSTVERILIAAAK
jgi:hypothetical protein